MKLEPRPSVVDAQPVLPLAMSDQIAEMLQGSAVAAFCGRRIEQQVHYGHTPESDAEKPLDHLLRQARARIDAALEILGHGRMAMPPERREQLLRYGEVAGATLIAAYERLATAPIASFETEERPVGEE